MVLPLAGALMLPAMAQQNDQTTTSAPTDQTQSAGVSQTSPDQILEPLTQERHEGFWGKINPFARKKYVQRQMEPIRNRVNELDELTASNSKAIKDVDSRAQEGIRLASAKANEADQHALDAGNRAQMANQTAQQASTRLTTVEGVVGNIDQYQPTTQAEIHFRPGQMALTKKAKDALDEMSANLKDQKGYIVEVEGFSSGRGEAAVQNSQRMAQSVVRYLVLSQNVPVYRIYLMGMGNAPVPASANGTPARRTTGGRVEVSLLKNGVDQLANPTNGAAPSASTGTEGGVSGTTTAPAETQPSGQSSPSSNTEQPSGNSEEQPMDSPR
jgi:outer membrane protein OmpA-like peptidoglycan-associated protein